MIAELDLNMLDQLGRTIAQLHEQPAPECLPKTFPYGMVYFPEAISDSPVPEYSDWLKEKLSYLSEKIPPGLPTGLIHGDVFNDNVLFAPHANDSYHLAAIIDFEEACDYYQIFDIGMAIVGTCLHQGRLSLIKAKSLVGGYQSKRQLEAPEKESLQLVAEYAAAATSFWRFRQHHILKPDGNKANDYLEMKLLADQLHSIPEEQFRQALFFFPG